MRAILALLLLAGTCRADVVDVYLCHEKQPPILLRLTLPSAGEVRVRRLPAALPASGALTKALARAFAEKDADKLLARHDTDEDSCLSPLELVPDLLTTAGKPGRPHFAAVVKKGNWLDDLLAHYEPDDDKAFAASLEKCKTIEVALKLDAAPQLRRSSGLTLDLAATNVPGKAKAGYTLFVAPQPRGWFEWLDADQDGQLSLAEIRNAGKRLGKLAPREADYSLTLLPGVVAEYGVRLRRPEGRATRGPAWFAAMDRNGDGFVSRAEWLGTAEAFDELDRDGDGLISPEEARAGK
jgi:hypothetical protein